MSKELHSSAMELATSTPAPLTSEPWQRLGGETPVAFTAFAHYRDAGEERQLKGTAEAVGRHYSLIRRWAARWNWRERVLAFDHYMGRVDMAERRRATAEMSRRHAKLAMQALDKVAERFAELSIDELSAEQTIKWLDIATRIERQARDLGQPGQPAPILDIDLNFDQRQVNVSMPRAELAAYLDRHPDRIPFIVPVVQQLLAEGIEILKLEPPKDVTPTHDPPEDHDPARALAAGDAEQRPALPDR